MDSVATNFLAAAAKTAGTPLVRESTIRKTAVMWNIVSTDSHVRESRPRAPIGQRIAVLAHALQNQRTSRHGRTRPAMLVCQLRHDGATKAAYSRHERSESNAGKNSATRGTRLVTRFYKMSTV